jgi:quinol monooxygenase YgiN
MPLVILAIITANPGQEDLVRQSLNSLVAPTRAEDGCIQYDLHQDNDTPGAFMFYEIWASRDLWQAHLKTPHIAAHKAATAGALAHVNVSEMTVIA